MHCNQRGRQARVEEMPTLAWRLFRASQRARTTSQAVMGPAVLLLAEVSLSWLPFRRKILGICRSTIFSPTPYDTALCSGVPVTLLTYSCKRCRRMACDML